MQMQNGPWGIDGLGAPPCHRNLSNLAQPVRYSLQLLLPEGLSFSTSHSLRLRTESAIYDDDVLDTTAPLRKILLGFGRRDSTFVQASGRALLNGVTIRVNSGGGGRITMSAPILTCTPLACALG